MNKFSTWFKNLTRVGKFGFISAVALSGVFVISATATPAKPAVNTQESPKVQAETKKEPVVTTKTEVETQPIAFAKQTTESASLAKGTSEVQTIGIDGVKTITYTITLTDGVETGRTSTEAITKQPVDEITAIGTYVKPVSNCNPNYSGCVPNVSYDLDCPDIGYSVRVIGYDQYRLDRDNDGYGCESY
jgi:hypothetical protein